LRQSALVLRVPDERGWAAKLISRAQESCPSQFGNTLGRALFERNILVGTADEDTVSKIDQSLPLQKAIQLYPDYLEEHR